jgi:2-hydroxychromene-2-carboxylate isomerase
MKSFEFWFDFGSPSAYLAWTQIPKVEATTGAVALYKPMLLGGVFQATGNQSPVTIAAKGKYTFTDLARYAKRYRVPLNMNPHFPVNTLLLMRGAIGLQMTNDPRFNDYCRAVFHAIWVDSLNMNDPATVGAALQQAGFNVDELLALANNQTTKDALKAATQTAVERGIFGAPTFFVGNEMFWGQDRLEFVTQALQIAPS